MPVRELIARHLATLGTTRDLVLKAVAAVAVIVVLLLVAGVVTQKRRSDEFAALPGRSSPEALSMTSIAFLTSTAAAVAAFASAAAMFMSGAGTALAHEAGRLNVDAPLSSDGAWNYGSTSRPTP